MSTPLLKAMKPNGTTFFAFPSTSINPDPDFTKFVLINIPARQQTKILDFSTIIDKQIYNFPIYTDNLTPASTYADQLVESLRNYVDNHDVIMREAQLTSTSDFYNINELKTPTEKIFFKWLRKFGAIDFEPAQNGVDWDKSLSDFNNPNEDTVSHTDYFRQYLWKERVVANYTLTSFTYDGGGNFIVLINTLAKFKVGDTVILSGDTGTQIKTGYTYSVIQVDDSSNTSISIWINDPAVNQTYIPNNLAICTLNYQPVVQYIGEINAKSDVHTATLDEVEIIGYIPNQAGQTPTILFETHTDSNYYPNLTIPILPSQTQTEIYGAENFDSPIRQNPSAYPGSFYGQFDTLNYTYQASSGDKLRLTGQYYGINLISNVGLNDQNYIEKLSNFNSDNLDGINIDFDLNHYLKMQITDSQVGYNFDEFDQLSFNNQPPKDFQYNAILWYSEKTDDRGNTLNSLYGITFLNYPNNFNDTDPCHIVTYQKLVSTSLQDGLSYQHVLNISTSVDSDTSSLSFDPTSLNNTFGFDLYSNLMSNMGKLNETYINNLNQNLTIMTEINNMKSLIYTQTDIDMIKSKLLNLESLLQLYSTYQFVNTDTVTITTNYGGVYPTLGFNVNGVYWNNIITLTATDLYNNQIATNALLNINIPSVSNLFIHITNNDNTGYSSANFGIVLSSDLNYKQTVEILLDANGASVPDLFNININFNNGTTTTTIPVISNIYLPVDIGNNSTNYTIYNKNKYLTHSAYQYVVDVKDANSVLVDPISGRTLLYTDSQNIFGDNNYVGEWVYVNDLKFLDVNNNVIDNSGMYQIIDFNQTYIKIQLDINGLTPVGVPTIYSYKALKIRIFCVDNTTTSTFQNRYLIEKIFI